MRNIIILSNILLTFSCTNTIEKKSIEKKIKVDTAKSEKNEPFVEKTTFSDKDYITLLKEEFKDFSYYKLSDTIIQDLTGDKIPEKIFITKNSSTSGITIIDGQNLNETKIGFGNKDEEFFDEFNWVDYWAITNDKETNETLIKDDELVGGKTTKLKNPGIVLRNIEAGGGIIIFENGKYRWIHQSC